MTVPPHSLDAEEGLLGCLILEPGLIGEVELDWFYSAASRNLVVVLVEMFVQAEHVDLVTVAAKAREMGMLEDVGGVARIASLPDRAPTSANFPYWKSKLVETMIARRIVAICETARADLNEGVKPVRKVLQEIEHGCVTISDAVVNHNVGDIEKQTGNLIERIQAQVDHPGLMVGVPTGFHDLDNMIDGLKPQELVIIAARPSVGKTTLGVNMLERMAVERDVPVPCGIFSLEMSAEALIGRIISSQMRVDGHKLLRGQIHPKDFKLLADVRAKVVRSPLFIDDRPARSIAQIRATARVWREARKIEVIVVDYLGLVRSGQRRESQQVETSLVSQGLKAIAKELGICVVALCQLNRQIEQRSTAPILADLRDSGAIEQDADVVLMLNPNDQEKDVVMGYVRKNRNGPVGKVMFTVRREFTRFESYSKAIQ